MVLECFDLLSEGFVLGEHSVLLFLERVYVFNAGIYLHSGLTQLIALLLDISQIFCNLVLVLVQLACGLLTDL